ncbi:MAG: phage portal protein [Clostridiales Family XIII bacterium]|jgi:SPP1 family phage portal protein|nr:phage portal protein [Clostridiales Family XIII bacterium]
MIITDTQLTVANIKNNSGMTTDEIIKSETDLWLSSRARENQLLGEAYYRVNGEGVEILKKEQKLPKRSNIKRVHPFVRELTDQKVGYLLANDPEVATDNARYKEALDKVMDKRFMRLLMRTVKDVVKCGMAYWQPYFNSEGGLAFKRLKPWEVKPLWLDDDHEKLGGFIRVWEREEYVSRQKKAVRYVTYGDDKCFRHYRYEEGGTRFEPIGTEPHFCLVTQKGGKEAKAPYKWGRAPLVYWKANAEEQGIVEQLKSLVDDYDRQASKNSDLLADLAQLVWIIKGYGGQNLGSFMDDLLRYMALKVDGDGGVDTIKMEPDTDAVAELLARTRQDLYQFGRGVDTQNEDLGNASGQAIRFRYGNLDLDSSIIESELQASFEIVEWFIQQALLLTGQGDFTSEDAQIVFHRDTIINEKEIVEICAKSKGVISDKTIMEHHPWAAEDEGERLAEQEADAMKRAEEYQNAFGLKAADGDGAGAAAGQTQAA